MWSPIVCGVPLGGVPSGGVPSGGVPSGGVPLGLGSHRVWGPFMWSPIMWGPIVCGVPSCVGSFHVESHHVESHCVRGPIVLGVPLCVTRRKCLWTQILTNWIFLSVRNFIEKGKLDHNQSPVPAKTTHFSGNCAGRLRDKCQMTSSFHAIQRSKHFFHSSNLNIPPNLTFYIN